uniref:Amino acid transporter transmembrane domain-containing protein n=1 Tax=Glossina brevipalpis TaxID=37001 RepID=A0A1A9W7L0_9MUSC
MPAAFANAGYVNGLLLTIIIGFIAVHNLHIMIDSMYELCKRKRVPYLAFSDAMTVGFEEGPPVFKCILPIAKPFVDGFLAFYHFGTCCVYVVFIAESIKQIIDEYSVVLDVRLHMCFILLPLFLIFSIRNLQILATFSSIANLLLLVGFGVILYYIFDDLPAIQERKPFENLNKLPIFFGTILFALEAIGVILAIEENMETPKAFVRRCGTLNLGMLIVLGLYMIMGFFGYWKYGDTALGSVTLNLSQKAILAQVTKIFFAITIWISYALQGYVTANILWNKYLRKRVKDAGKYVLFELLIRGAIVLLTFALAIVLPDLSLFLSLVGAFCLSVLGLIFPPLLQICVQYRTGYGKWKLRLIKNLFLVTFGAVGGIVGTYVSITEIVQAYA